MSDDMRTPGRLVDMLGFDYFTLLDTLTIARSRRHIEKYYGTEETGKFPDRLKPVNIKSDVDSSGAFPAIRDINQEIRRLHLASYAPLRYVLPHRQEAYDKKYSTEVRGGEGFFRQVDREESLIHLIRINVLKRMESAVSSFALTIERQLRDVEATIERIDDQSDELEEIDISDIDLGDPAFCKSETIEGIGKHGFVLTPGRYVGAEAQEDDGEPFTEKYPRLLAELEDCFGEGERLLAVVREKLKGVGDAG